MTALRNGRAKDALGRAPGMPALLGIGCGKFLQSIFPGGLRHGFPDGFVLGRYAGLWGAPVDYL